MPNTFTPVGSLSEGVPLVPALDLSSGVVRLPAGAGVTTLDEEFVRGTITSWNVTAQKLFPHSLSVTVGYVANRQNDQTRQVNLNYGQIGGGAASQPYNQPNLTNGLRTTAAMNVYRPWGKITYDSLQLSVTRRMIQGFQFTSAYTYARAIDWWAGNIAIPEYYPPEQGHAGRRFIPGRAGRDEHTAQGRRIGDLSAAVRLGTEVPELWRRGRGDRRGLAGELHVYGVFRRAVYRHVEPPHRSTHPATRSWRTR